MFDATNYPKRPMKFEVAWDYAPHSPEVCIDFMEDWWYVGLNAEEDDDLGWEKILLVKFSGDWDTANFPDPKDALRLADAIKLAVRVMAVWNPADGAAEIEVIGEV